jgi:hypothetical protein
MGRYHGKKDIGWCFWEFGNFTDELAARISFVCSGWSYGLWAEGKWSYDLSSLLLLFFVFMLFTSRFLS